MLIVERQQKLLDLLRRNKTMQLDDLAAQLDVSSSTVRRDLESLEKEGHLQRTRAGAIYTGIDAQNDTQPTYALASRMTESVTAKKAIARTAAQLISPGMTVLLDGGSTVIYTAQEIAVRPLQIVTNSLSIANQFKDDDQIELVSIGGVLYPRTEVTLGPIATNALKQLHADILFFSLAGLYDNALFNINMSMAEVEQQMMQQATQKIGLMDSSKFGRKSLAKVCDIDQLDLIITDPGISNDWKNKLGKKLLIAK
ncbi:HTH-type transcriptional repressor GlcR [Poriferisphaera corsica]|uniref:HTH-type transcriptional repressor GlcR n=1 Tax=Poriferisphaera corsica TaxID=2528020 RepID=A0A517YUJ7_9BACT|nr:DeoR/GlpR family DNA-binding transcription regulator [Poriferisphaera corsica]QDU33900.1 HTH-type transcriptional repressor GlcR [Poriferisphaera corsica]